MKEIKRKQLSVALIAAIGTSVLAVSSAYAQQAQKVEKIEVTGSNIKRTESETAEPIIVLSREDIQNSGKSTLTEYLQTLPLDGQGSLGTSFGNGFAAGATTISLRGLGASATLVLVNGRRLAPYPRADDFQKLFSDISSIPFEAVERIEILKDGASAIYGSDALAGVVNIILRKDFNGFTGKVEGGTSRYSDGNNVKAGFTVGAGDLSRDRWNGFVNVEASKTDEIHYRDRSRQWIGKGDVRPYGYDALATQWTPGYLIGSTASPNLAGLIRNGTTSGAWQLATPCTSADTTISPRITGDNGCSYDIGNYRSFSPKLETVNVFGRGTFAINENWEVYGEAAYGKNKTGFDVSLLTTPGTIIGPYGVRGYGTGLNVPELTLAAQHPDNPFGKPVRFRYAFGEFGPQRRLNDVEITRVLGGIKGSFGGWDFDAGISHSESKLHQDYMNLSVQGVINAFMNPNSPTFGYRFNNPSANTDAQRASLLVHSTDDDSTKVDIVDAKMSRELFQLAGGAMGLAVGTEYRKTTVDTPPFTGTADGTVFASVNGGFKGDQKVWAAYAEVLAPVVKNVELGAAVRYDKYDNFSSTTPKASVKWVPVPQVALRASYAEGFRAPNIAESSASHQAAFGSGGFYDPIRCPNGTTSLAGVPADCNGSAAAGVGQGNPDLKPEKSKNYNLGIIFEPMRDFSIGADYWRIKKKDQIQSISTQDAAFLPTVVRSDNNLPGIPNSGSILVVYAPFVNLGSQEVTGMDVDLSWRWRLADSGRMKMDVHWTRTNSFKVSNDAGDTVDYAGTHGNCDVSNCIGTPRDKVNAALSWDQGPFGVTGIVNWRSIMRNISDKASGECLAVFASGADAPGGCEIPAFWTLDVTGRWDVTRHLQLYGSVSNLFDRVAPLDPTTYGGINYNPMDVSGAMGRYYRLGLKFTFK